MYITESEFLNAGRLAPKTNESYAVFDIVF